MPATEQQLRMGEKVFSTICNMLDANGFRYETDTSRSDPMITLSLKSDIFPVKVIIFVRPERELVSFYTPVQLKVPEDKRVEIALAVTMANERLIDGCFDYTLFKGELRFRITAGFIGSLPDQEQFRYMLGFSESAVKRFTELFLMLTKSVMTLEQFYEAIAK